MDVEPDEVDEDVDLMCRSYFNDEDSFDDDDDNDDEVALSEGNRKGFCVKNPGGNVRDEACNNDDLIFTPSEELLLFILDGGWGVRNKGSVDKLLKFKLSLHSGSGVVAPVATADDAVTAAGNAIPND